MKKRNVSLFYLNKSSSLLMLFFVLIFIHSCKISDNKIRGSISGDEDNLTDGSNSSSYTLNIDNSGYSGINSVSVVEGSTVILPIVVSPVRSVNTTVNIIYYPQGNPAGTTTRFNSIQTSVTIPAGQSWTSFSISSINDSTYQGNNETFEFVFSSSDNFALFSDNKFLITLTDDDSPLGVFSISGITSSAESVVDNLLSGNTTPTVHWTASSSATSYDVEIYADDGLTNVCSVQSTVALSLNLVGCNLTRGTFYRAKVASKFNSQTLVASNNLYRFFVNQLPTTVSGGEGPWYVLSGSSITINALGGASPIVGVASDPDGDTVSFTSLSGGTMGSSGIDTGSLSITYNANSSGYGVDTLSYTIKDTHGDELNGTITIHIVTAYTWTGMTSSSWNTASNWCGSVSADKRSCAGHSSTPSTSSVIIFDQSCTSTFTCSPSTPASISVGGVKVKANGFTQASTHTITIGSTGWSQSGGVFNGGTGNITLNGSLYISGGTFNSTSGILDFKSHATITNSTSFVHNSGTMRVTGCIGPTFNFTNVTFYNVTFSTSACSASNLTSNSVMKVLNLLSLNLGSGLNGGGVIEAYGNVNATWNYVYGDAGYILKIKGSGNQTITGDGDTGGNYLDFSSIEIASTGGTVTFAGSIAIGKNFTYTSGNVSIGTTPFKFAGCTLGQIITTNSSVVFGNVTFQKQACSGYSSISGTMVINGNLIFNSNGTPLNNGSIEVKGNATFQASGVGGTTNISLTGSSPQTITHISGLIPGSTLTLNNPSGYLAGSNIGFGNINLSILTGNFDLQSYLVSSINGLYLGSTSSVNENTGDMTYSFCSPTAPAVCPTN